jgi:segregation and condensation protein A
MPAASETKPDCGTTYTGFPVKIEIFEGPLDLLLHLVRRQELEIAEVSVAAVTDEYLRYLHTMAEIRIDVAAEFLVMAANLLWLKSRALLPRQEEAPEEQELADEELIHDEQELQQRLEEYRAYKEAAALLAESKDLRQRVFLRPLTDDDEIGSGYVPLADVSLFDMVAALQEMLERTKETPASVVRPSEITVADCIEDILLRLRAAEGHSCNFVDLVDMPTTRVVIILVFLATLELIRRRQIRVSQGSVAHEIRITLVD